MMVIYTILMFATVSIYKLNYTFTEAIIYVLLVGVAPNFIFYFYNKMRDNEAEGYFWNNMKESLWAYIPILVAITLIIQKSNENTPFPNIPSDMVYIAHLSISIVQAQAPTVLICSLLSLIFSPVDTWIQNTVRQAAGLKPLARRAVTEETEESNPYKYSERASQNGDARKDDFAFDPSKFKKD